MTLDLSSLPDDPREGYARIHDAATRRAGGLTDITRRVMLHHQLYRDSGGNHAFPLVALHGALWAAGFFETTGRLGQTLRARYFYSAAERATRMAMLQAFAEGFRAVNRLVFIDTFTNYLYTKHYGDHPAASGVIHPELFDGLREAHDAARRGVALSPTQRRTLFTRALQHEQEVTVAPGVQTEVERFDCPILRALCLRPVVRFSYFPWSEVFFFKNFASKDERIEKALRSFEIADRAGWGEVEAAMARYGHLPEGYARDPAAFVARLPP
jgi:hypothetical protein